VVKTLSGCGGTGLAGIGQLADFAGRPRPARGDMEVRIVLDRAEQSCWARRWRAIGGSSSLQVILAGEYDDVLAEHVAVEGDRAGLVVMAGGLAVLQDAVLAEDPVAGHQGLGTCDADRDILGVLPCGRSRNAAGAAVVAAGYEGRGTVTRLSSACGRQTYALSPRGAGIGRAAGKERGSSI
jgi:hypothetical protein